MSEIVPAVKHALTGDRKTAAASRSDRAMARRSNPRCFAVFLSAAITAIVAAGSPVGGELFTCIPAPTSRVPLKASVVEPGPMCSCREEISAATGVNAPFTR